MSEKAVRTPDVNIDDIKYFALGYSQAELHSYLRIKNGRII